MDSDSIVQVRNVAHSYGARKALGGVTFDVRSREIFGVLGPNGGGKTTLFKIISTSFLPGSGEVLIFGSDVRIQTGRLRRRIGVVFQNPSLDRKLTVAENLQHQGHLYGLRGAALQSRMTELMDQLAITDRAQSLVETLSGGLQRRVELAKGLLHRPDLLILDEPSVGLDPGARRDLWLYLQKLRDKENVTILLTTHMIDEADRCDRVLILNQGIIVAMGSPDSLKDEIGGDVVVFTSAAANELRDKIASRFNLEAAILNGRVRIEKKDGHALVSQVVEAFPDMIDSVTLSKPTLEDVFTARTGHRFWDEE